MPNVTSFPPMNESRIPPTLTSVSPIIDRLKGLSSRGLVSMFDAEKQLFCYILKKTERGMVQDGISQRYTIMCLLGLHRLEESGAKSPIAIGAALEGLLTNFDWIDNVGDLGLVLWLCAILAPQRLTDVEGRLDIKTALTRFADSRKGITVHLAWFLTGLSYSQLASREGSADRQRIASETYKLLTRNQGAHGTFGFHSTHHGIAGLNRGRIGCFADQVYPIYALSRYSQAYGEKKAALQAAECGRRICEAQGSLGQWWWHYDSTTSNVIGRFPVFSVHQHAMAPMALQVLGEATRTDFSPWIFKGLEWINRNELGFNMEDASANVVWRCISPRKSTRALRVAASVLTRREDAESREGLKVLFQCRPYELGWLLYAFANSNHKSS